MVKNCRCILLFSSLLYLLFVTSNALMTYATVPANDTVNSKDIFDCFNEENFEISYKYVHWKHHTSKKLSPNHRIIMEGNIDVEAAEGEQGKYLRFWKNNKLYFTVDAQKGVIPIFTMQKQSYVKTCKKLFCDLIRRARFKNLPRNYNYTYADGSANVWKITEGKVEYVPITPENSSSGKYSGGEPFEIVIESRQFQEVEQLMLKALKDKAAHLTKRSMGTGAFSQSVDNALVKECYLNSQSAHNLAIKKYLRSLKP